jgi:hypothetical protein
MSNLPKGKTVVDSTRLFQINKPRGIINNRNYKKKKNNETSFGN